MPFLFLITNIGTIILCHFVATYKLSVLQFKFSSFIHYPQPYTTTTPLSSRAKPRRVNYRILLFRFGHF